MRKHIRLGAVWICRDCRISTNVEVRNNVGYLKKEKEIAGAHLGESKPSPSRSAAISCGLLVQLGARLAANKAMMGAGRTLLITYSKWGGWRTGLMAPIS